MKEVYGDKVRLVPLGQRRSIAQRLGLQIGAGLSDTLMASVEERALWARYGL